MAGNAWEGIKRGVEHVYHCIKDPRDIPKVYKQIRADIKSDSNHKFSYWMAGAAAIGMAGFIAASVLSHGALPAAVFGGIAGAYAATAFIGAVSGFREHRLRNQNLSRLDEKFEELEVDKASLKQWSKERSPYQQEKTSSRASLSPSLDQEATPPFRRRRKSEESLESSLRESPEVQRAARNSANTYGGPFPEHLSQRPSKQERFR
jgi:hypothetical protein